MRWLALFMLVVMTGVVAAVIWLATDRNAKPKPSPEPKPPAPVHRVNTVPWYAWEKLALFYSILLSILIGTALYFGAQEFIEGSRRTAPWADEIGTDCVRAEDIRFLSINRPLEAIGLLISKYINEYVLGRDPGPSLIHLERGHQVCYNFGAESPPLLLNHYDDQFIHCWLAGVPTGLPPKNQKTFISDVVWITPSSASTTYVLPRVDSTSVFGQGHKDGRTSQDIRVNIVCVAKRG